MLLENGGDVDAVDNDGRCSLHGAASKGHLSVTKVTSHPYRDLDLVSDSQILISHGANIDVVSNRDETPLFEACVNRHFVVMKVHWDLRRCMEIM